jgi:large subunit ribosomal protein L1
LVEKILNGWLDFDSVIATPDMMKVISKLGKILGTRGLMPNPKVGTVTLDIGKTVKEIKSGKVEYRTEKNGIVHASIGKVSFGSDKLIENFKTLLYEIQRVKPASSKGVYFKNIVISTTMGVGIKLDASSALDLLK